METFYYIVEFSFAGNIMRICGNVTMTVQMIHEGLASGNIPFKANMVLDLYEYLKIDAVAGVKLQKQLAGEEVQLDRLYFIWCSEHVL